MAAAESSSEEDDSEGGLLGSENMQLTGFEHQIHGLHAPRGDCEVQRALVARVHVAPRLQQQLREGAGGRAGTGSCGVHGGGRATAIDDCAKSAAPSLAAARLLACMWSLAFMEVTWPCAAARASAEWS